MSTLPLRLALKTGQPFAATVTATDGPFPGGATLVLHVGELTWPATLDGSAASWTIAATITDTIPSYTPVTLVYTPPAGTGRTLAEGRSERDRETGFAGLTISTVTLAPPAADQDDAAGTITDPVYVTADPPLEIAAELTVDNVELGPNSLAALENTTVTVANPVTEVSLTDPVDLSAATLAALESVTATIANLPADYPDAATLAKLEQVRALLAATLTVTGTVTVANPVTEVEVTNPVTTVALDAAALAALEQVDIGNLPTSYPLPAAQVDALAPQTDALTDAELRAAELATTDSSDQTYTHVVATVTAAGDTTVHTPAAGKRIRLRWLYAINDPTSSAAPLIKVRLGAVEIYRVWALSKRQVVVGGVDQPLVINLSQAADVAVTALLEETP